MTALHAARAMKALAQNADNTDAWEGITEKSWSYLIPWDRVSWCILAHVNYRQADVLWDALEAEERRRLRVTMLNIIQLFSKLGEASDQHGREMPRVPRAKGDLGDGGAAVPGIKDAGKPSVPSDGKGQAGVAGSAVDAGKS